MFPKTSLNAIVKESLLGKSNLQSFRFRRLSSQAKPQTSEVHGDTNTPLVEKTLGNLLKEKTGAYEHRDALRPVHQQYRWTFLELEKWSSTVANGIYDLNMTGKEMLVNLKNDMEHVLINLAGTKLNMRVVNIPIATTGDELGEALGAVKPTGIFMSPTIFPIAQFYDLLPEFRNWRLHEEGPIYTRKFPSLKHIIHTGNRAYNPMYTLRDIMVTDRKPDPLVKLGSKIKPTDPIVAFVTGNYGSKPTELQKHTFTHRSIASTSQFFGERIKLRGGDRILSSHPLSSQEGQLGLWSSISQGAFTVIPGDKFHPEGVLKALTSEKCNYLFLHPQHAIDVFSHANVSRYDTTGIDSVVLAGNASSSQVRQAIELVQSRTSAKKIFVYSDGVVFDFKNYGKGTPLPHVQVKVVDNKNSTTALNATGTLLTKGIHNRIETVSSKGKDESEWVSQGTHAKIDSEGFIHLV